MFRLMVGAAAAALSINTFAVYNENFDAMDAAGAKIPGWKFYDQNFAADCTTATGNYGPDALDNRNYTTTNSGADPYFRAGLEAGNDNVISNISMRVYENFYAEAACNRILVFVELTKASNNILANTEYKLSAKMMNQKYGTNVDGSKQGMFYKTLDVDAEYNETLVKYADKTPPEAAAEQSETFCTPADMAADDILQIGFYAQGPTNQTSGAVWDDVSLTATGGTCQTGGGDTGGGDTGGGDNGGGTTTPRATTPVPSMPLGGLLGLIALVGWLGLRRRG